MAASAPLMPKATAVWLVDNTSLTFEQIADFCGLHPLEVKGIADEDVAKRIKGQDPLTSAPQPRSQAPRTQERQPSQEGPHTQADRRSRDGGRSRRRCGGEAFRRRVNACRFVACESELPGFTPLRATRRVRDPWDPVRAT